MAAGTTAHDHHDFASSRPGLVPAASVDRRRVVGSPAAIDTAFTPERWQPARGNPRRCRSDAGVPAFEHRMPHPHAPETDVPRAAYALHSARTAIRGDRTADARLTRRERQVLHLVASGLTDREIGLCLCIGARTAEWHLGNVFNKLGLSSRAAAAAYAVRHGIA
jgi:DNA-binding CsgD family transcriptional regulator